MIEHDQCRIVFQNTSRDTQRSGFAAGLLVAPGMDFLVGVVVGGRHVHRLALIQPRTCSSTWSVGFQVISNLRIDLTGPQLGEEPGLPLTFLEFIQFKVDLVEIDLGILQLL